jgi:chitinase
LAAKASSSDDAQRSQTITLQANHSYKLSADVDGNYAFLGATTAAGDTSTWTPSASGYTKLSVAFSTGSSASVTVSVHGWYGQGTVYVDDVSVS